MFAAILSIAVFTSRWWMADQPQLEDRGSPPIHSLAIVNAVVIFFQVILGAGFRHKEIPVWPHMVGSPWWCLAMVIWTAVVLRRRFEKSRAISKTRILLHSVFGSQFLLGTGAYWSRSRPQMTRNRCRVMVALTVTAHRGRRAAVCGFHPDDSFICYRLVPRRQGSAVSSERPVAI